MADLSKLPMLLAAHDWISAEALLRDAAGPASPAQIDYNLAKVLEAQDRFDEAGVWLERAVEKQPDYAIAWFELGRWALDQGDLQSSLHAFRKAAELDPADKDARRNVARLALRLGLWHEANSAFGDADDMEARLARYRCAVETGEDGAAMLDDLLADTGARPLVLKAMTRTGKGRIPLALPVTS